MYDLIIIGGGPAGLTAAVYAIRKRLNVLLVSNDLGGKTNYNMTLPWMDKVELLGSTLVDRRLEAALIGVERERQLRSLEQQQAGEAVAAC